MQSLPALKGQAAPRPSVCEPFCAASLSFPVPVAPSVTVPASPPMLLPVPVPVGRPARSRLPAGVLGLGLALLLAPHVPVLAHQAHEHGSATMDVALEGANLVVNLITPVDNLVGFERAPRTQAERQAAEAALARLRDGAALFRLNAEAGCVLADVAVKAPVLEQPAAARSGHADANASYEFRCKAPAALRTVDVRLFDAFARLERVRVQAALPGGQRKATLRRQATVLRLRP